MPKPLSAPTAQCQAFAALLPLLEKPETYAHARTQAQAHLATCAFCRAHQGAYQQMEEDARRALSPASSAPRFQVEELLRDLLREQSATPAEARAAAGRGRSTRSDTPAASLRVLAGLGSLAVVVAIVALAVVLFANLGRMAGPGYPANITPSPVSTMDVPTMPVSTPGPSSKYVTTATTAKFVSNQGGAVEPTTRFPVGTYVYVVVTVRNVSNNQPHIVYVRWYYDGVYLIIPGARTSLTINGNTNVDFALAYGNPGAGTAKIYFDPPAGDTFTNPNDPSLAQTISFAIVQPTGTRTPGSAGTPSPHASIAALPVAWRSGLSGN